MVHHGLDMTSHHSTKLSVLICLACVVCACLETLHLMKHELVHPIHAVLNNDDDDDDDEFIQVVDVDGWIGS